MPPRKPTAIKKLEGNPGKRPLNENEPQFDSSTPTCPAWLTQTAKREWRRVLPLLTEVPGLITQMDRAELAAYCQCYADYVAVVNKIKSLKGTTYEVLNAQGETTYRTYPEIEQRNSLLTQIRAFCTDFGGNPVSRSRMTVPQGSKKNKEIDPLEELLGDGDYNP